MYNGEFIQCAIENNKDASICLNCKEQYKNVTVTYTELMAESEVKLGENITCRSIYVDVNLLNLIDTIYHNAKGIWDSAYCSGK